MSRYLTEFVGTFFLVLIIALTGEPLVIGAGLMAMVYMGGHVSGAHYNPAVTIGMLMSRKIKNGDAVGYIIAQMTGAFLATAVAYRLTSQAFIPAVGPGVNLGHAFVVEVLFTFALVSVVFHTAATTQTAGNSYFGLAIGFTVFAGAAAVGGISGGAFNPAVGVAPLLFDLIRTGTFHTHMWLYIMGPIVGAVLGSLYHSYTHYLKMTD